MKKLFSLTVCLLTMVASSYLMGQSYSTQIYDFATTSGTFTPLSGATRVSAISDSVGVSLHNYAASYPNNVVVPDLNAYVKDGFPIGFDFAFHGDTFNEFIISGRGFIKLGRDSVSAHVGSLVSNLAWDGKLSNESIGLDGDENNYGRKNTSISYQLEGATPNRILTVEFLNLGYNANTETTARDSVSYQIKLYEGTNKIEFVFGVMCVKSTSVWFGIGIVKSPYSTPVDAHFRIPTSYNWLNTTSSTTTTNATVIGNTETNFPTGTTFTFTTPAPCADVTASATDIDVTARASTFINGSLSMPTDGADGYAIYVSDSVTVSRENMTLVAEGALTSSVTFQAPTLSIQPAGIVDGWKVHIPTSSKKYFYAYLTNYVCLGDKKYGPVIMDSATFMPLPPTFAVESNTSEAIVLSATARNADDSIIIAVSSYMSGDPIGNAVPTDGWFGILQGVVNIGDTIQYNASLQDKYVGCPFRHSLYSALCGNSATPANPPPAGIVIYKGKDISDFTYTDDLQPNRVYYFGAWTKNAKGEYSTVSEHVTVLSLPTTPYTVNFAQSNNNDSPFGWTCDAQGKRAFTINFGTSSTNFTPLALQETEKIMTAELPFIKTESKVGARISSNVLVKATTSTRPWPEVSFIDESVNENDSISFEFSTNGVDYTLAKLWTKDNMPPFNSTTPILVEIPLEGTADTTFKVRICWKYSSPHQRTITFSDFIIEDVPPCEPIAKLNINAGGTSADISWILKDGEEPTVFDVRYRPVGDDNWTTTRVSGSTSTTLTDLPLGPVDMEVGVRVVCAISNYSDWVSGEFKTGYDLPFYDDFDMTFIDLTNRATPGSSQRLFPGNWDEYKFSLNNTEPFDIFNDTNVSGNIVFAPLSSVTNAMYLMNLRVNQWKGSYNGYQYNNGQNQAMIMNYSSGATPYRSWLLTKEFSLQSNTKVAFDISVKQTVTASLSEGTGLTPGAKFYVAFVPSSGTDTLTVTKTNLLLELDSAAIMGLFINNSSDSVHYDLDLSNFIEYGSTVQGRIGFNYVTDLLTPASLLYLDNVAIETSCVPVKGLAVTQSSIDSINIEWTVAEGVSDYLVRIYDGATNGLETVEVTGASYKYVPATAGQYGFSVGYSCAEISGDTVWSNIVSTIVSGGVCDAPSNITVTEITTTSATIVWDGEGIRYNIQVRALDSIDDTDPTEWETYVVTEKTYAIEPLVEGKTYQYHIQTVCGDGAADTSEYSAIENVTPKEVTCFPPTEITAIPTYYNATVSWTGSAASYEYGIRQGGSGEYTVTATSDASVVLTVSPSTAYQIRVRSICDAEDISVWSEPVPFTTPAVPVCPLPIDPVATAITQTSATLSWTAPADYAEFVVTYHAENVTAWDTAGDITAETSRVLENLTPNTVYVWRVRNLCDHDRSSSWANADNFKTLEAVAVEDLRSTSTFKVYASKGQIHILNPNNEYIGRVTLTSATGATLQKHAPRTVDNVLITTSVREQVVVVSIYGKNRKVQSTKVLLK
ncbi:MAG: fibronectin type III domain-containing protein [Bacteroidales bacterium]|jgi:hypothetical protein|nr:fibronectin type III domain-containing protein [Bacteroidales bacterium]